MFVFIGALKNGRDKPAEFPSCLKEVTETSEYNEDKTKS